jgi:hypothetical protein
VPLVGPTLLTLLDSVLLSLPTIPLFGQPMRLVFSVGFVLFKLQSAPLTLALQFGQSMSTSIEAMPKE